MNSDGTGAPQTEGSSGTTTAAPGVPAPPKQVPSDPYAAYYVV